MDFSELPHRPPQETVARYARIRQEIHLFARTTTGGTLGLSLSHWVDWEIWQCVKKYFIEAEEGDWFCTEANAAAVEAALHILPENQWERVRARHAASQATAEATPPGGSRTLAQEHIGI